MPRVVPGSLIPNVSGIPLDARLSCDDEQSLPHLENPYVGMRVWLQKEKKEIIVTEIKESASGIISRKTIGSYEVSYPAENTADSLGFVKPAAGVHLRILRQSEGGTRSTASVIIDTLLNEGDRLRVKACLDSGTDCTWVACPASGFGTPFDGSCLIVELPDVRCGDILYFAWYNEQNHLSDYQAAVFPSGVVSSTCSEQGTSGTGNSVAAANVLVYFGPEPPETVWDGLLWVQCDDLDKNIQSISGVTVLTQEPADLASVADGTIILGEI